MLDVRRYGARGSIFGRIIFATNDHFWKRSRCEYIDFSQRFAVENEATGRLGRRRASRLTSGEVILNRCPLKGEQDRRRRAGLRARKTASAC